MKCTPLMSCIILSTTLRAPNNVVRGANKQTAFSSTTLLITITKLGKSRDCAADTVTCYISSE